MAETVSKIKLDVAKNNIMDFVLAKQGDKASRFLEIELQNNGEKIEVAQTSKVYLNAEKPDSHITRTVGEVLSNGHIKVGLTNQTLAVDGTVTCDVSIETAESKLTSLKFTVKVEPCTAGDDVVVSTDEFTVLDEMVIRVDELETTVTSNEADRIENEIARQEAEVERVAENIAVKNLISSFVGNMPIANTATPGAVKAGGDITISTAGLMSLTSAIKEAIKLDTLKANNPVGTVRKFAVATNPATLLGFGTWEQVQKGRVGVGVYTPDSDFDLVGKTGGNKTQELRAAIGTVNGNIGAIGFKATDAIPGIDGYSYAIGGNVVGIDYINHSTYVKRSDGSEPTTIQPYQCFYYWQRTA